MVDKLELLKQYNSGATLNTIAQYFNVSRQRISQILRYANAPRRRLTPSKRINPNKSELWVANKLESLGLEICFMPTGSPFDILVDNRIRIEVKFRQARITKRVGKYEYLYYNAHITNYHSIDYLVLVTGNLKSPICYIIAKDKLKKNAVVPVNPQGSTLHHRSRLEAWHLITEDRQTGLQRHDTI